MTNLAANPDFATNVVALREQLMSELRKQHDPRVLGQGDVFEQYASPRTKTADAVPEKKQSKEG